MQGPGKELEPGNDQPAVAQQHACGGKASLAAQSHGSAGEIVNQEPGAAGKEPGTEKRRWRPIQLATCNASQYHDDDGEKKALATGGGAATRLNSSRSAATVSTRNASHQPADSDAGRFASHNNVPNPQDSAAIDGIPASNADRSRRMFQSDAAASPKLAIKNAAPASVVALASSARTPVAAQTGIK